MTPCSSSASKPVYGRIAARPTRSDAARAAPCAKPGTPVALRDLESKAGVGTTFAINLQAGNQLWSRGVCAEALRCSEPVHDRLIETFGPEARGSPKYPYNLQVPARNPRGSCPRQAPAHSTQRPRSCTSTTSLLAASPRNFTVPAGRQRTLPHSLQTRCG